MVTPSSDGSIGPLTVITVPDLSSTKLSLLPDAADRGDQGDVPQRDEVGKLATASVAGSLREGTQQPACERLGWTRREPSGKAGLRRSPNPPSILKLARVRSTMPDSGAALEGRPERGDPGGKMRLSQG